MDPNTNTPDTPEPPSPREATKAGEFKLPPLQAAPPQHTGPSWSAGLDTTTQPPPPVTVSPDASPAMPVVGGDPAPPTSGGTVVSGGFSPPPSASPPSAPGSFGSSPTPIYGGADPSPPMSPPSAPRSFKMVLIALLAVVIVGGGSAAAYFGMIVPNKPANVLKSAIVNSLQQKQSSFKGTLEANAGSGGSGGLAIKADINGSSNSIAKTADFQLNLTVSGISFPVEARLVDKTVYIKVGDLRTIANLVSAYSPEAGSLATSVSSQLSNKWISIDSTLVNESGAGCVLDTNWNLTQADIQMLEDQYSKSPFVTIQSTASDTVNGQKAEKFALSIDDDKIAAAYGNAKFLNNLSIVKAVEKCQKGSSSVPDTKAKGDHKKTPITVWVDKGSKRIVKIAVQTKQSDGNSSLTETISYKPVSITAPANAEPAIQVFTDIQKAAASNPALTNLLNGGTATQ